MRFLSPILICSLQASALGVFQETSGPPDFAELRPIEARVIDTIDLVMPATVAVRMGRTGGSSATGVLIGDDLVLSAGHVGERSGRRAFIELSDGRTFQGRSLGQIFDAGVDVGLIRIKTNGEDLPKIDFGSIDDVAQGDWVIMLGHAALTPDNSEELAVPAARVGRILRIVGPRLDVDAPFDSGDSGGPVVDLDGRLIGIVSKCGHYSWQNVATNIRTIKKVLPELKEDNPDVQLPSGPSSRRPPRTLQYSKRNPQLLENLDHLTWSVSPAIAEVFQDDRLVCHGTVIEDGLVLTKASLFLRETDNPILRIGEDRFTNVTIVAIDPRLDLVLLEVLELKAPRLDWDKLDSEAGRFLVVPTPEGRARSLGAVSRDSDHLKLAQEDKPFIGIGFDKQPNEPGLRVTSVVPSSSAREAGIEIADIIRTIDAEPIDNRISLQRALKNRDIGDKITIGLIRNEKEIEIPIRLGIRSGNLQKINSNTTTGTSRHSSGYGEVILCDAVIEPHEVGTPLVDLNGRAVGLAIARRGRTVTVVLPSERVRSVVDDLRKRAQEDTDDLEGRMGVYRSECTESPRGRIVLDAGDAIPRGDAIRRERFDDGKVTYGSWSDEDDALEWKVRIEEPGRFRAILTLACSSRNAGTPIRLSVGDMRIDGQVESTGGWGDFEEDLLGECEVLEKGEYIVRLEPLATPRRELMNFARLELIRIAAPQD